MQHVALEQKYAQLNALLEMKMTVKIFKNLNQKLYVIPNLVVIFDIFFEVFFHNADKVGYVVLFKRNFMKHLQQVVDRKQNGIISYFQYKMYMSCFFSITIATTQREIL